MNGSESLKLAANQLFDKDVVMRFSTIAVLLVLSTLTSSLFASNNGAATGEASANQLLDINVANAARLAEMLPGIGPAKAALIVQWRTENGHFTQIDQLQQIKGIGPKTVEKLRAYVRIGSGAAASQFLLEQQNTERQVRKNIRRILTSVRQAALPESVRSLPRRPWYEKSALELLSFR